MSELREKIINQLQDDIKSLIRQDNPDFYFDNMFTAIDWMDTKALAEFMLNYKNQSLISELEGLKEGAVDLQYNEWFINIKKIDARIEELKGEKWVEL